MNIFYAQLFTETKFACSHKFRELPGPLGQILYRLLMLYVRIYCKCAPSHCGGATNRCIVSESECRIRTACRMPTSKSSVIIQFTMLKKVFLFFLSFELLVLNFNHNFPVLLKIISLLTGQNLGSSKRFLTDF